MTVEATAVADQKSKEDFDPHREAWIAISQTHAAVTQSKNKAYGAGNRLYAWIQTDHRPAAIDAHNQGMAQLKSAESYLKRVPKQATEEDWLSYGHAAMEDFGKAIEHFKAGLALYPAGKPPQKA